MLGTGSGSGFQDIKALWLAITPAPERVERLEAQLRQEWQQRNSRQTEARTDMKQQIEAIEGKIAALLDRIMDSDSPTVISAYERKVDQLGRDKLVLQEKTARCLGLAFALGLE